MCFYTPVRSREMWDTAHPPWFFIPSVFKHEKFNKKHFAEMQGAFFMLFFSFAPVRNLYQIQFVLPSHLWGDGHFSSKNDSSLYKGAFADRGKPCPYGMIYFHSVRSTHFFSLFTIHFSLPDRAYVPFATQKMDYEFDSLFNHIWT